MKNQSLLALSIFIILIAAGIFSIYYAYYDSFYAINRASALFSRAETAGFAEEVISYLERGRAFLPTSGNPVWWFPTDRTNFGEIQHDLQSIINRATILDGLPRNSTGYQTGMEDLRGRIMVLQLQIADASGYLFVSADNLVVASIWIVAFAFALFLVKRR